MVCNSSELLLRCFVAAIFITFISAMPYIGIDDWENEGSEFQRQVTPAELRPNIFDDSADTIYNSESKEFDRVASRDTEQSLENNGFITSHRTKRFGFGLLPMGFSYRIPIFPRRNRRINSRNYVAMRGKRLNPIGGLEYNSLGQEASLLPSNESVVEQFSRPTAGVWPAKLASINKMQELFPGMGVYVHQDQYNTALNKSVLVSPQDIKARMMTQREMGRVWLDIS